MKKVVFKAPVDDQSSKKRVLKMIAGVQGVDSVAVDMKEKKITVIGDMDPVFLTSKIRKIGFTELLSVGPAKEEQKEGEKPKSDAKNKAKVPAVVTVPSSSEYRPFEYFDGTDGKETVCVIS